MEILLPTLRLVHIMCGVYWAGTMFFVVGLLEPSTRAAGPAGGAVMRQLIQRGYLNIMPGVAVLNVVSGLWLYWIVSGHLNSGWGHSRFGTSITIGAVAGIIALIIGLAKMRPAGLRMFALGSKMASVESDEERDALLAEMRGVADRARNFGRAVAGLLVVAVVGMAVARYL